VGGVALLLTQWHVTPGLQGCQRVASLLASSLGCTAWLNAGVVIRGRPGRDDNFQGNFQKLIGPRPLPLLRCNAVVSPSALST
jgi:hypothetical protein